MLLLHAEGKNVYARGLHLEPDRGGAKPRTAEEIAHLVGRTVDQYPLKDVIHVRLVRIGGHNISDDQRPAWQQSVVCPIDQVDDEFMLQVVRQCDAVDERLWREFGVPAAERQSHDVVLHKPESIGNTAVASN